MAEKEIYDRLTQIANGTYKPETGGSASSLYNAKNTAQQTYNNLYDYYNANKGTMSEGELSATRTALGNAKSNIDLTNNYYDQYTQLADSAMDAKAEQYAAQQNALKYTNAALKANGYGSQGLSESAIAGINNTYAGNINSVNNTLNSESNSLFNEYQRLANENNLANQQAVATGKQLDRDIAQQEISTKTAQAQYDEYMKEIKATEVADALSALSMAATDPNSKSDLSSLKSLYDQVASNPNATSSDLVNAESLYRSAIAAAYGIKDYSKLDNLTVQTAFDLASDSRALSVLSDEEKEDLFHAIINGLPNMQIAALGLTQIQDSYLSQLAKSDNRVILAVNNLLNSKSLPETQRIALEDWLKSARYQKNFE